MDIEWLRSYCLSLPHVTEEVQWEDHLLFKIGGKMFAMTSLNGTGNFLSMKASPEKFPDLVERPGVIPAPYLARAKWISLEQETALPRGETKALISEAYDLVLAKLPKRVKAQFGS